MKYRISKNINFALAIVFVASGVGLPAAVAQIQAEEEVATSYTTTPDGFIGDINTTVIEKELASENDALFQEILTQLKADTDANKKLIRQIIDAPILEEPTIEVDYSDNQPKDTEPDRPGPVVDQSISWWSRVTNWLAVITYRVKSWLLPASQAATGNCRPGDPTVACNQAAKLKTSMEKARAKQKESKEKLKQKIEASKKKNQEAYKALTGTWVEKCYDPNKKILCRKINQQTGDIVLPDGTKFVNTPLTAEDIDNPNNYDPLKYAGKIAGEVDIWFETQLIVAEGPTMADSILLKVATIACETGIMGDGTYYIKRDKVYYRANPADNLCSYPLGSSRGKEILQAAQTYNRRMRAYLKTVDDVLARMYKRSLTRPTPQQQVITQ